MYSRGRRRTYRRRTYTRRPIFRRTASRFPFRRSYRRRY